MATLLASLCLAACGPNATVAPGLALTNVAIIDVETGDIAPGQTIIVRGDRIEYVGDPPPSGTMSATTVADYSGHYVVPGLWDMHVHLRNSEGVDLTEENALWLPQYLGFGVTAVRDAGGDLADEVIAWRREIDLGDRQGPRIYTSLQKLDGSTGGWPGSIRLESVDEVSAAIDTLQRNGADFIKLYDGSLDGEVYLGAIAEAEKRGIKTAGHMPMTIQFEDAIRAGLDSVEHELYLAKAASTNEAQVNADIARAIEDSEDWSFYGTLERLHTSSDTGKLKSVFDEMIMRGAALTPTLYISAVLESMTDAAVYDGDPQLAQTPPGIRDSFQLRVTGRVAREPDTVARHMAVLETNISLVKAAAEHGVIILAGSDTGAVNSFLYPGDSLHEELAALVSAGLSPLQALQGATVHAAEWLNQSEDFGTVEIGKKADLLILERNPLTDIKNSRSIVAVLHAGKYFDSSKLDQLRTLPQNR